MDKPFPLAQIMSCDRENGGFLNIGANYENQGKTFRAIRDTNWQTNPNTLEAQPVAVSEELW